MFSWMKKKPVEVPEPVEEKVVTVPVSMECDCKSKLSKLVGSLSSLRTEIADLEKQRSKAKRELEDSKLKHKITLEDIKHMQKMLDEKTQLELDKKIFEAQKEAEVDINDIRKEYAQKLEKELMEERKKMQEFMQKVMDALPNVNVKLSGK